MALLPKVKLKTIISFPGTVSATSPLTLDKSGGQFVFGLDITALRTSLDPIYSVAAGRPLLTADRTYYVRTDGNDINNGLANSSGGAFLTIAKAMTVASGLDCGSWQLTIQVSAGTYTVPVVLPRMLASLTPILTGVGSTTIINTTSANGITNDGGTPWQVNNLKLQGASAVACLYSVNGGVIKFQGIEFGSNTGNFHIFAQSQSSILATGNYTITGNTGQHVQANGFVAIGNAAGFPVNTVTLSGTPAFTTFVVAQVSGYCFASSLSFAGTGATGIRYSATLNGNIFTGGGGANFFPGNAAGSTATGGNYA